MIKLITHNDLDGVGCYIVANYFLNEEIEVSFCSYKNVNEIVLETIENQYEYTKIFITDISVSEEVAKELDKIGDKVKLLDHHQTALFLNEYSWATVEEICDIGKTCGTQLLFDYLNNSHSKPALISFVEHVRRYDTWEWQDKFNDEKSKQLNDLMYIIGRDDFYNDMIEKVKNDWALFSTLDEKILELRQKEIDRYMEKKNKKIIITNILGYNAGVVFADNFISELGNKLSEWNPELDFIAMINQETISYRTTKDDINLSEISKHFGGGGHPKASGSSISVDKIEKFIDILFN